MVAPWAAQRSELDDMLAPVGPLSFPISPRWLQHVVIHCYHEGMIRTQISLSEEQAERLRAWAAARGVSQASVMRQALDAYLERDDLSRRLERARAAVGAFRSGYRNTAECHDEVLDEAFSS